MLRLIGLLGFTVLIACQPEGRIQAPTAPPKARILEGGTFTPETLIVGFTPYLPAAKLLLAPTG